MQQKFAEMLGEDLEPNMKATTKDNLKWRVDCEFGATAGKFDLAKCAKKTTLMQSMTLFMRWPEMRLVTAKH